MGTRLVPDRQRTPPRSGSGSVIPIAFRMLGFESTRRNEHLGRSSSRLVLLGDLLRPSPVPERPDLPVASADLGGVEASEREGVGAVKLMRPAELVVPVLGAGVSVSAGMPSAAAMSRELLSAFDADQSDAPLSLTTAVDSLLQAGVEEKQMLAFVAEHLAARSPLASPLVEALIRVPSRFITTLNFDLSVETAAHARGASPLTLGNSRSDLQRALRILGATSPPAELTVLHLHGHIGEPERIVLGREGYARIGTGLSETVLYELAVRKVLAFYGTTLDEPYFLAQLQAIPNRGSHVLWCRDVDRFSLRSGRNPILPSRSDIYIGTVKHFEDLPATLGPVLGGELPATPRVRPAGIVRPDPLYVENDLRDRRRFNDPEDLTLASIGLPPRGEMSPDPTETDALDGLRTIIIGEPGSGKSELLRSLAARTKAPRTGVFIRLADLEFNRELGPKETLAAWTKKGLASRRGADVSQAAIERGRYHFFLDGLDEVDSGLPRAFRQADQRARRRIAPACIHPLYQAAAFARVVEYRVGRRQGLESVCAYARYRVARSLSRPSRYQP